MSKIIIFVLGFIGSFAGALLFLSNRHNRAGSSFKDLYVDNEVKTFII